MGLPVIVYGGFRDVENVVNRLISGYKEFMKESPSIELVSSWKSSLRLIARVAKDYPVVIEYPVFGGLERVDFVIVGRRRALIVEAKGWKRVRRINEYVVEADGRKCIDPCYQLNNYLAKFKLFHSASSRLEFDGVLFLYNSPNYSDNCNVVTTIDELGGWVEYLGEPGDRELVEEIVRGSFTITSTLIDVLKSEKYNLLNKASMVLLSRGYGLTQEQMLLLGEVLEALRLGDNKTFLVRGVTGSGKTLVALTLLFEAVSRGYKALLAYKNNRLLNTLRRILHVKINDKSLADLIVFYSTGPKGRFKGLGEENFPVDKYGELDLVIFDEAQRMTEDVIRVSMRRGRVRVYFYDEEQILLGEEEGTRDNFIKYAINPVERVLSTPFRTTLEYLKAVRSLLEGKNFSPRGIDFRIFEDIREMLHMLKLRASEGMKVALICAFTESEGDKKNPDSPKNIRIGHPLQSGFDLYKDLGLKIRWLMNEKTEYPEYWQGLLDPLSYCVSVYGAQGFEADYVGIVWGRDLIWRGKWVVNPEPITDNVGGRRYSLKSIAKKDKEKALVLLKNRYYIMLTRGIKGVYVFFEDEETRRYVQKLLRENP